MGLLEGLFLLFLGLKLAGAITWSWWLVFAPLYPAAILYTILLLAIIYDWWTRDTTPTSIYPRGAVTTFYSTPYRKTFMARMRGD